MSIQRNHGSPYDRGSADSYYQRGFGPHWYPEGTGNGERIQEEDMSPDQIAEYTIGFEENEQAKNFKDWD